MQIDLNKIGTINSFLDKPIKDLDNEKLARTTMLLNFIKDDIESLLTAVKNEILIRPDFEKSTYFSDEKTKVVVNPGKKQISYNVYEIGKAFESAGRIRDFFKIVNIIGKQVEEHIPEGDPIRQSIANNKSEKFGDPYVSVAKMTKEEVSKVATA